MIKEAITTMAILLVITSEAAWAGSEVGVCSFVVGAEVVVGVVLGVGEIICVAKGVLVGFVVGSSALQFFVKKITSEPP
jgi:hypothetical protein